MIDAAIVVVVTATSTRAAMRSTRATMAASRAKRTTSLPEVQWIDEDDIGQR